MPQLIHTRRCVDQLLVGEIEIPNGFAKVKLRFSPYARLAQALSCFLGPACDRAHKLTPAIYREGDFGTQIANRRIQRGRRSRTTKLH